MLVGIYNWPDHNGFEQPVNRAYREILEHNGIPHKWTHINDPDFWNTVGDLDLLILRWAHHDSDRQFAHDLLPVLEREAGVSCFPNQATCWHYDDKARQSLMFRAHNWPFTQSWIFWERDRALAWAETAEYPVVFKLRGGAGSTCVWLLKSKRQARAKIKSIFGRGIHSDRLFSWGGVRLSHFNAREEFRRIGGRVYRATHRRDPSPWWRKHKNYAYFQKYLPGNDHDTRVTVIGERAFAFRRLTRKNDFRASGSGMIDYNKETIDPRCLELAFSTSKKFQFQCMAYDFLYNESGQPEICEISYTFVPKAVYDCGGYWDLELNYHEGSLWPEYCQLVDLLHIPDLKQPELQY